MIKIDLICEMLFLKICFYKGVKIKFESYEFWFLLILQICYIFINFQYLHLFIALFCLTYFFADKCSVKTLLLKCKNISMLQQILRGKGNLILIK